MKEHAASKSVLYYVARSNMEVSETMPLEEMRAAAKQHLEATNPHESRRQAIALVYGLDGEALSAREAGDYLGISDSAIQRYAKLHFEAVNQVSIVLH